MDAFKADPAFAHPASLNVAEIAGLDTRLEQWEAVTLRTLGQSWIEISKISGDSFQKYLPLIFCVEHCRVKGYFADLSGIDGATMAEIASFGQYCDKVAAWARGLGLYNCDIQ